MRRELDPQRDSHVLNAARHEGVAPGSRLLGGNTQQARRGRRFHVWHGSAHGYPAEGRVLGVSGGGGGGIGQGPPDVRGDGRRSRRKTFRSGQFAPPRD